MNVRPALVPMLKPLSLAILLVTAFVLWVPNPEARRPDPPPTCEELAAKLAFRFHPLAQGRSRPLEEQVLNLIVPAPCRAVWSYDPPRSWDLARLDRRPRPKEEPGPRPGRYPVPIPDERPGWFLQPNALS
ncbi:MAG TPA: hypothetical protein VK191_14830 [Symbiobacteriaceae bacterium]|nr:hypothetical protein [Symbiobacteriaceae bacterium]